MHQRGATHHLLMTVAGGCIRRHTMSSLWEGRITSWFPVCETEYPTPTLLRGWCRRVRVVVGSSWWFGDTSGTASLEETVPGWLGTTQVIS